MKSKTFLMAVAAAALGVSTQAHADLIVNGGFEVPPPAPYYQYRQGNDITGWTISTTHSGIAQFDSTYRPVGAGHYSIQIESGIGGSGGGTAPDSISQMVSTLVPSQKYSVSFLLSAWSVSGGANMDVTIDGVTKNFTSFSQSYASHSFDFVASSSTETLTFENVGVWGISYPQIDSVSLTAVPEPTTLLAGALLLLPFGASTLRFMRKNRKA